MRLHIIVDVGEDGEDQQLTGYKAASILDRLATSIRHKALTRAEMLAADPIHSVVWWITS